MEGSGSSAKRKRKPTSAVNPQKRTVSFEGFQGDAGGDAGGDEYYDDGTLAYTTERGAHQQIVHAQAQVCSSLHYAICI